MAKKSAKSKGYRKTTAKKPYLSKRDIAILCALVVVLAVGAFFLFRYDDGALKVKGGEVVTDGDNWLIVNGSNVRGRARYFKLGEIGEVEGYSREAKSIATDSNVPEYVFTPEAEDSGINSITVTTSHSSAEALAKYAGETLSGIDGTDIGEVQSAELGGKAVTYFTYTAEYTVNEAEAEEVPEETAEAAEETEEAAEETAEAAEETAEAAEEAAEAVEETAEAAGTDEAAAEPNHFTKSISGYIDGTHDSCVAIHMETNADSPENYLSDEALTAALAQVAEAVTLEAE